MTISRMVARTVALVAGIAALSGGFSPLAHASGEEPPAAKGDADNKADGDQPGVAGAKGDEAKGDETKGDEAGAGAKAAVKVSDNARRLFKLGVDLLEDPEGARNEEAFRAFMAAYSDSPSPKILGNLGLCAMRLERDQEALDAWTTYLTDVPDAPASFRAQVEKDLGIIKTGIVRVTLAIDQVGVSIRDERITIEGKKVSNLYGPFKGKAATLGIRAGNHRLTLSRSGFEDEVIELDATPGATLSRQVTLRPLTTAGPNPVGDDAGGGIPAGAWVGVGVTGALAIATGVSGGLALGKASDFDAANTGLDPAAATSLRDDAATLNLVADIMLGATIAAAATTVVLFIVLPSSDSDEADEVGLTLGPLTVDGLAPFAPDIAHGQLAPTALTLHGRF